ncbi:hypothetical protein BGZ68_010774, partial [Mortierella alpina]
MTKKSKTSVPEHDEHGDERSISSQHMRKRDKFINMFRSDKSEVHTNPSAPRPEAKTSHTDATSTKARDDYGSAYCSTAASSSGAATPPTTESTKIRMDIFSTNVVRPASKT